MNWIKWELTNHLKTTVSQKNSMKFFGITLKCIFFCHLKRLFWKRNYVILKNWLQLTLPKKDHDKRFTKNWKPILNVNVKLISKVLSNQFKNLLPNLILSNQNAYVINRFISEGGKLISASLKMNIKGWNIFNHKLLYTAQTDDTTFFLKDENPVFETLNIFHKFSLVFGQSSNRTECEIVGIGTG